MDGGLIQKMLLFFVGIFIGAVVIFLIISAYPPSLASPESDKSQEDCLQAGADDNVEIGLNLTSKQTVSEKAKFFLENSDMLYGEDSLKETGRSIEVLSVEEYGSYLYKVMFDIVTDGSVLAGDSMNFVFTTKDGEEIMKGMPEKWSEPRENNLPSVPQEFQKTEKPVVRVFFTSFQTQQNAIEIFRSVDELFGEKIELKPHFIVYSDYGLGYPSYCLDENNIYCSTFALNGLREDIRRWCILKYDANLFWDYLETAESECEPKNIESCWREQAESLGIGAEKIEECLDAEALEMLPEELRLSQEYQVTGSPRLFINDVKFIGKGSPELLKEKICSAFIEPPKECLEDLNSEPGFYFCDC